MNFALEGQKKLVPLIVYKNRRPLRYQTPPFFDIPRRERSYLVLSGKGKFDKLRITQVKFQAFRTSMGGNGWYVQRECKLICVILPN